MSQLRNSGEQATDGPAGGGPGSAVDQIVMAIRRHISEQGLSVGDRLPTERELCERYNAGRNTVREAMRILKAYGMVDVRPKVGATIADNRMARAFEHFAFNTMEVSRKTFSDVQAFRDLLEVGSVDILLERLTAEDIDEMRAINAELADIRDLHEASEIDFRFHVRLITILDNAAMLDVYTVMKPVIIRIMEKGKTRRTFRTDTLTEHESVVDALEARDRLAFQYKLRSHLNFGFRHFREQMEAA